MKSFRTGRSDRFFRRIYEQAATGIAITDWLGVFQECNPAYCALLDYTEEELRTVDFVSLIHPDDREANLAQVQRLQAGEISSFDIENRYIHKNGAPVWVHKFVSVLPGEDGEPAHLIALVTNTTGRHHAEEMLRTNEAELMAANTFLDAIFENIPLMLFIKESQSLRFIRLNRTSEDLLGWPNETLEGKNAYDFWPKEQAEFFIEKDRETLNRGSEVDIPEEPILTRYRGVRTLHTKKVPILDAAGNPVYLLGISEDITERKRFEEEQQLLADVSVALSTSLEYEQTLANLARLVVHNFADWSAVDVMDEEGRLSQLKVASADPDQAALCAVLEQLPSDRDLPHLMRSVIESKRPVVVEQVTL